MAQDYLDQLAEFVADTRFEDLPPDTIAAARDVVLDTLGAITAGSCLDENASFARLAAEMSGPGKSSIVGHPYRVQPVWATMVNATAGVALEMDEGNRVGGGHPSIHVTPGALAVGEDLGSSGRGRADRHHPGLRGDLAGRGRLRRSNRRCIPMAPGAPSARRRPRRG